MHLTNAEQQRSSSEQSVLNGEPGVKSAENARLSGKPVIAWGGRAVHQCRLHSTQVIIHAHHTSGVFPGLTSSWLRSCGCSSLPPDAGRAVGNLAYELTHRRLQSKSDQCVNCQQAVARLQTIIHGEASTKRAARQCCTKFLRGFCAEKMQQQIALLVLLASLGCAACKLTEWPLTLHHDIVAAEGKAANDLPLVEPPYHSAGYMPLPSSYSAKLFYFYFEVEAELSFPEALDCIFRSVFFSSAVATAAVKSSPVSPFCARRTRFGINCWVLWDLGQQERTKRPNAPLIFWTNGGPGCSSLFGLFKENGPYVIQPDCTLKWREFGWDVGQNIVFVDQPVGTGFSEGDDRDYAHWEAAVGSDMLEFFLQFFVLHPELSDAPLYLTGESYAGECIRNSLI